MKTLFLTIIAAVLLVSCKKQDCQPKEVEKLIYVKGDSIHTNNTDTIKIHDTVLVNNVVLPLIGTWNLYKLENYTKGAVTSTDHPNYISTFAPTQFMFKAPSGLDVYDAVYGQGYMEISKNNSVVTLYFVESTNNGKEYKLTKSPGTGSYQVWYFKK
jgi:hypothetical protein